MQKKASNIKGLRMQARSSLHDPETFYDSDDFAPVEEKHDPCCIPKQQIQDEEQEFSFATTDFKGMLIFADEMFENGKIRPTFPISDQSLLFTTTQNNLRAPLKKIFVEQSKNSYSKCSSSISKKQHNELIQNMVMVEMGASNKCYGKSNSTGSSNLWKFRQDMNLRSNSDHNDSFVFFKSPVTQKSDKKKVENITKKREEKKHRATLSAHEKLYMMHRTRKENSKRRSFLPYKQQLFGFFTNVNGLKRSFHPF